ncbi:hypothetical protein [Tabrizicola sp.]|uniref:hypothetical protein n=1 Tax=Tabrizicola sp. TaxID=2005166 RepID=UPI00286BEE66|nr:hypothetical protein [Tabrizicola sp.]
MPFDEVIFGAGIYSPREAARLVGGSAQEVLRWTRGSGPTDPLWKAHYQFLDDTTELSFVDLIEVRVVKALRRSGISLQAIRFALDLAENRFGVSRPLATRSFKLLGGDILMDAIENDGEFVSLSKKNPGQKVFAEIVKQSLNDLEYENDYVARWRPTTAQHVVIDPARLFGTPMIDAFGVSTQTIYREFLEFQDARYLSKIYEIPIRYINDAVKFEQRLDAAQELNG